jgi:hypothetical protein
MLGDQNRAEFLAGRSKFERNEMDESSLPRNMKNRKGDKLSG